MKITDVFIQNNEIKQQTHAKNTDFEKFLSEEPAIPAVLGKSGCKWIGLKAFHKPLKAMDGFRERQDGFMRVCEKLLGQSPCWHSLFSAGMAGEEPSKANDDYYQIHQQQLEQSALTFHPLMTSSHKSSTIPESKASLKKASTPTQEMVSLDSSLPREEFLSIKKLVITTKIADFFQKPLFKEKETLSVLGYHKPFVKQPQIEKIRSNSRIVLSQQPSADFKNHQVVVLNNQVELSINTTKFSKQTSRDLQTRIKQWLVENGYVLKQLTINGVIQ